MSLFPFRNAELEAAYNTYMDRHYDLGTLAAPCFTLAATIMFVSQYSKAPQEVRALLPQVWRVFALRPLLAILSLSLQITQPQAYVKHQKAVRLSIYALFIPISRHARGILLWSRMNRGGQLQRVAGRVSLVQDFLAENMFFSTAWVGSLYLDVGRVIDLLMVAISLHLEIKNNSHICASTGWGGAPLGSTGDRLVEAACTPVRAWIGLPAPLPRAIDPSECPAYLMVWQVLGAVIACAVVLLKGVLQRRAFLRSNTGRALIPIQHRPAAQAWPFCRFAGSGLVLGLAMCLAMLPYLLQLGVSYCLLALG